MKLTLFSLMALLFFGTLAVQGKNFTRGTAAAQRFGVHEIELRGGPAAGNPFAVITTVKFTQPSGRALTVHAFYDGGTTWRARVYVTETGLWRWQSPNGQSGTFQAVGSALPGMLRPHRDNPRQWMTEDGRWFPNLSDTAYFLFHKDEQEWQRYIRENVALGVTSVRALAVPGKSIETPKDWDVYFAEPDRAGLHLENFQTTDRRLEWMLENYPELYVQFILLPLGCPWGQDETFWTSLPASTKTMLMRYMLARFAAYPQIFWLVVNDAPYGPRFPNNNALAAGVGEYFREHDPWKHLLSTGPRRYLAFPFRNAPWASYYHIEDAYQLGADVIEQYRNEPVHVFLGEDRYEQDRASLDPRNPAYYYRCLFWSWLLAGGSANYAGRHNLIQPYSLTASPYSTVWSGKDKKTYTNGLRGLNSTVHIRKFFEKRKLDLARFQPHDALVSETAARDGLPRPKLARRGAEEYLVYLPNARAGGMDAAADADRTAQIRVDLGAAMATFQADWYRAEDGAEHRGATVEGGAIREFTAPWKGCDVVLHLRKMPGRSAVQGAGGSERFGKR